MFEIEIDFTFIYSFVGIDIEGVEEGASGFTPL